MNTLRLNGNPVDYDVTGVPDGPTLLLLSGWCQDHRLFDRVRPLLAERYRVIRADWRGHGEHRGVDADFGVAEQADDVVALLDALDVDRVIPLSTSHGGWANIEVAERLGVARVPRCVVIDWIMVPAGEEFTQDLRAIQDPRQWLKGRQSLFDTWLGTSDDAAVVTHLSTEMASYDFDMWARSCRVIADAYDTWDSPLARMDRLTDKRPVTHLYSQPAQPDYTRAQREFSAAHPWFTPVRLPGATHFPTLESPRLLADHVQAFATVERR